MQMIVMRFVYASGEWWVSIFSFLLLLLLLLLLILIIIIITPTSV